MQIQLELARQGVITTQMAQFAEEEGFDAELIRERVEAGEIVIPNNPNRPGQKVVGIGTRLRTKVNSSIGTSSGIYDIELEKRKARIAEAEGADTLMELSTGSDLDRVRCEVLDCCQMPVGNVPLYLAFHDAARRYRNPDRLDPE